MRLHATEKITINNFGSSRLLRTYYVQHTIKQCGFTNFPEEQTEAEREYVTQPR